MNSDLPRGWQALTLFDLADRQKSRFDDGDWVEAQHITDKGVRLIQTGNIGVGAYLEKDAKKYIFDASFQALKCKPLEIGDLLICRLAEPAGRACIFPDIGEEKVITSVDVTIFRPDDERYDRGYLAQYFSTAEWFDSVVESVGGTTHKRISRSALGKIEVPVPASKAEQSAIATALADFDALLATQDALIAKKRAMKQGAMQALLTGKRRLPGFSGKWMVRRLDQLAKIDSDNLPANTSAGFSFNYIALEHVDRGSLKSSSPQVFASAPSRARRRIIPGDIMVSTVRPNLQSHLLFSGLTGDWVCSTGFCVLRCLSGVAEPGFVYAHFFSEEISLQIEALLAGSNYPAISNADVKKMTIPVPEYDEQKAIAEALSDMNAEIASLQEQRAKTTQLKQGMMQQLLTGRIRLI